MQTLRHLSCLALVHGLALTSSPANPDANAAPYFQIIGNHDESSVEALPLKSSAAKVTIDGTIARVTLTQHYANSGKVPIEALYVFPASTRAAVHGMTVLGIVGELALQQSKGPGSFAVALIDALAGLDRPAIMERARICHVPPTASV